MGTGFSMDPNEYHAAANAIDGYGDQQADNGAALASGTSTPLSSSGSGIAGAIAQIAQGTVQKMVTDVTSTTQGFANDTAKGLRAQANNVQQLETDLAGHANALGDNPNAVLGSLGGGMSGLGGSLGSGAGSVSTDMGAAMTTDSSNVDDNSLGASAESGEGALGGENAAVAGGVLQEPQQESTMMPGGMRGAAGAGGGGEQRGQRPDYLKSKGNLKGKGADPMKAAIDQHLKDCGLAPIPIGPDRLVCAKCGSVITVDMAQPTEAPEPATPGLIM